MTAQSTTREHFQKIHDLFMNTSEPLTEKEALDFFLENISFDVAARLIACDAVRMAYKGRWQNAKEPTVTSVLKLRDYMTRSFIWS